MGLGTPAPPPRCRGLTLGIPRGCLAGMERRNPGADMYTGHRSFEQLTTIEIDQIIAPCYGDATSWLDPDVLPNYAAEAGPGRASADAGVLERLRGLWDDQNARSLCHRRFAREVGLGNGIGIQRRPKEPATSAAAAALAHPTSPGLAVEGAGGTGPSPSLAQSGGAAQRRD